MNFPINNVSDAFLEFDEEDLLEDILEEGSAPTEWDARRDDAVFRILHIGFNSALNKIITSASKLQDTMNTALDVEQGEEPPAPSMEDMLAEMKETVDREMEEFDKASMLLQSAAEFFLDYKDKEVLGLDSDTEENN